MVSNRIHTCVTTLMHILMLRLMCLFAVAQLFYSFFKTLVGKQVAVELKNDVALTGVLHSVDQYMNIKLTDLQVVDKERNPQFVCSFTAAWLPDCLNSLCVGAGCVVVTGCGQDLLYSWFSSAIYSDPCFCSGYRALARRS